MTAVLKVVVPVEVIANAPKIPLATPPTIPVKPILPEPDVIVNAFAAPAALSRVLVNESAPFALPLSLLLIVMPAFKTAGPV